MPFLTVIFTIPVNHSGSHILTVLIFMFSSTISFNSSLIHYSFAGNGSQPLLCFHGYGESEYSFHFLEKHLATGYFIIAVDMPFHGKTLWKEGVNFDKKELVAIVESLLRKHGFADASFSLLAYSMGGRIALSLFQEIPGRITRIILLAPDGLKLNFWYWLSTQTWLGNKLFAATIQYPNWFLWMLRTIHRVGLLNQSVFKFVQYFLHDKKMREQLYLRWTCFRKLSPNPHYLKNRVVQNKVGIHLIYGKHDRIIRPASGGKFKKGIEPFCTIEILNCGHQLLQEANANAILKYLPL